MLAVVEFLNENQKNIIELWSSDLERAFPYKYDPEDLKKHGVVYFQLLCDIHISLREHPLFRFIQQICQYHAAHNTPVEDILHSSHIWRKHLVKLIHEHLIKEQLNSEDAMPFFESLHERIDVLQREICHQYWQYAKQLIQTHEEKINQLHEDRLNLLGKMAASMAHEIKNPLFAIQGFLKLIRSSLAKDESFQKVESYLNVIDKESEGLYRQITTFLSFSKNNGNEEQLEKCTVDEIVASVLSLVYPKVVEDDIDMELIKEAEAKVMVQKTGIQQVLINLINNSIDALSNVDYSKSIKVRHGVDATGGYFISVIDNGPGIPNQIKDTLFEPFITTKKSGTGLGLSICRQIMSKNHGNLTCTSLEKETTFTMTLDKKCVFICDTQKTN